MIITRANDRRLRLTATDWVKNGDRWTITYVSKQGELTVRHTRSPAPSDCQPTTSLPRPASGYATTIHTAQGVTADTMHGLLTGQQSRQQLYTMLSRGRHANHLYLQVVGDGDPHTLIRPDNVTPRTPTEMLQQIARDEAPVSANTVLRELNDPAARLSGGSALHRRPPRRHRTGGRTPDRGGARRSRPYLPGLTGEPAWPTLRAHLLALAAETVQHPFLHLQAAAFGRDRRTAGGRRRRC